MDKRERQRKKVHLTVRFGAERPDKLKAMLALWDSYVKTNNVILPNRSTFETLEDKLSQRVPDDPGYPPLITKKQFIPPPNMLADPKP